MADAADMLAALSGVPEDTAEVLMCAHNPGMEEFAARFAGGGEAGALARLEIKFPTAALAVFRIGKKWAKQGLGKGELVAFVTPKDLV
jgi:phosphohistidine phosphatase